MSQGWSGNVATLGFAKQTAKGVAATTPAFKTKFTGGNIKPQSTVARLQETAATRDQGPAYKSAEIVQGNPSCYLRPDDIQNLLYYVLGSNVDAGAGPYTHTATPSAGDIPYVTVFKMLAAASGIGGILEKFTDVKVDSLKISAQNGQPGTVDLTLLGLTPSWLPTNDVVAVTQTFPFTFDQLTVSKGGVLITTCQQFDITIANNLVTMQGNNGITPYDIFPGELQASGSATILYEDWQNYRAFHYGVVATATGTGSQALNAATINVNSTTGYAAAGQIVVLGQLITYTSLTGTSFVGCTGGVGGAGTLPAATVIKQFGTAPSRVLYQEPLVFTLTATAPAASLAITCTNATYTDVPVEPDSSGAPITSAMAFSVEPGSPTIQTVTTNAVAAVA